MKYTVVCSDDVANQLAELVIAHWGTALGSRVTEAADRIEAALSSKPLAIGTVVVGNVRLLADFPLAVEYAVFEADRMVVLLGYHLFEK
jgi:hypothetical protein